MSVSLKDLYQKLILERQKDPRGYGKRDSAQNIIEAYNPVCGDQFRIYFDFDGNQFRQVSFHGYGCALSKASTSLLVEGLEGKSASECKDFIDFYFQCLANRQDHSPEIYSALAQAKYFPGREQCTILSWDRFAKFLKTL